MSPNLRAFLNTLEIHGQPWKLDKVNGWMARAILRVHTLGRCWQKSSALLGSAGQVRISSLSG